MVLLALWAQMVTQHVAMLHHARAAVQDPTSAAICRSGQAQPATNAPTDDSLLSAGDTPAAPGTVATCCTAACGAGPLALPDAQGWYVVPAAIAHADPPGAAPTPAGAAHAPRARGPPSPHA